MLRQDGGFSCPTLTTDGQTLCSFFYVGIAAALDLDGKLLWATHQEIHSSWEHGFGASPLIVNGRFVILLHTKFTAFEPKTGKVLWQPTLQQKPYAEFGSLVAAPIGSDAAILTSHGNGYVRRMASNLQQDCPAARRMHVAGLNMTGQLRVLDMAEGKLVYEQVLPLSTGGGPLKEVFAPARPLQVNTFTSWTVRAVLSSWSRAGRISRYR